MPVETPYSPVVKNEFVTPSPSVCVFHVTHAPTLTTYVPASVKLYSRNGSLACVLPASGVGEQAFVRGSTVHLTVAMTFPCGSISSNIGCAVKPSVSVTWKNC